jgi:signal transduction histidine kinase
MPNAKKVKFIVEVNQDIEFLSDELRLKIIFNNFISNAIKYQRPHIDDPYVWIRVDFNESTAIIRVKDNGKGIKEEYLDKIFDMFFRATQEAYGSGLGLYIVKQVIDKLHGKIDKVESVYGEGTEIVVSIPCLVNG